jgi:hypothetical protein
MVIELNRIGMTSAGFAMNRIERRDPLVARIPTDAFIRRHVGEGSGAAR